MNNSLILNLWERLNHIYGHRFASAYGESAFNENEITETARTWASGLRGVTGEEVAHGLRTCIDCGEPWPPTLPEFVAMCKGKKLGGNEFGLDYIPEYHRVPEQDPTKLLSNDNRDERRKKNLEQIRKLKKKLTGKVTTS